MPDRLDDELLRALADDLQQARAHSRIVVGEHRRGQAVTSAQHQFITDVQQHIQAAISATERLDESVREFTNFHARVQRDVGEQFLAEAEPQ